MKISKIVFMGTPKFSIPALEALINNGYKPILCITQPDKPKGRKRKLTSPPVKITAEKFKIEIILL